MAGGLCRHESISQKMTEIIANVIINIVGTLLTFLCDITELVFSCLKGPLWRRLLISLLIFLAMLGGLLWWGR
ncbi:protein of unknown function [Serratia sp. Tan611]|nr:protein of unknown function [Serratia sp. Tan611]